MLSTPTQHDITKDHVWEFQYNVTESGPVPSAQHSRTSHEMESSGMNNESTTALTH